jgi:hypothetical protein
LASPLLQQLLPSDLEHDFASPALAPVFAAVPEQHDFAGASLLVLVAVVVFDLSAGVTLCAETVETVNARISENIEITRATFFILLCINWFLV